jgi:hypothetical protein
MTNSTHSRRNQTVSTVKQVARDDPSGLLTQERASGGRGRAPWGGAKPVAAECCADGGGRDLHAKPQQLALDALVAPAAILSGQADDQLPEILVQRWSPVSTAW